MLPRSSSQPVLLLFQIISLGKRCRTHHIRPLVREQIIGKHTCSTVSVPGGVADADRVDNKVDVHQFELVDEMRNLLDGAHGTAQVANLIEQRVLGVDNLCGDAMEVLVVA